MLWNILLVFSLIALTSFFVATEFSIVKMRSSRVDQLVLEGVPNAIEVQRIVTQMNSYLSACQLGITIASLGLGWLGEPTFVRLLQPLFDSLAIPTPVSRVISFAAGFTLVTYISVVLGELAPKTIALYEAEILVLKFAKPIIWFYRVMYPFIWVLNSSANAIVRLFGYKSTNEHEAAHSEEEIRIILSESLERGTITKTEFGYVNRIFNFDDLSAKEIMIPRTDMVCLYKNKSMQENVRVIKREQYTRFPVADENKDHIIGLVNTKQLFLEADHDLNYPFHRLIRPIISLPESIPIKIVLRRMQQEHIHMAILLDEYGGTAGLITIEDILEEIVGEIRDEFDDEEVREIATLHEGHYLIEGRTPLSHVNHTTGLHLESEDADTIGGWLYSRNPELRSGQSYVYEGMQFTVKRKDRHRIKMVELKLARLDSTSQAE
ncbi:hemolysin family protein [Paenibacillus sp. ACRRX]|uniref:hemolysin family protein n=1 Tax=Paenibacillus sp. ACRRX TaxID=2918206 RepID=UPI001EF5BD9E|nr:hemolysin family protein [Paenibacillus sp. ACRRX]MCG7410141.1 hemolysin family protein [Paenibacillus sp. ACRRX]